jgi:hypothetical protein
VGLERGPVSLVSATEEKEPFRSSCEKSIARTMVTKVTYELIRTHLKVSPFVAEFFPIQERNTQ